jgi:hypothetical protein
LTTLPGLHGVLPDRTAVSGSEPAGTLSGDPHFRHTTQFLEFAQAAGGFGVFDLELKTGSVSCTP